MILHLRPRMVAVFDTSCGLFMKHAPLTNCANMPEVHSLETIN